MRQSSKNLPKKLPFTDSETDHDLFNASLTIEGFKLLKIWFKTSLTPTLVNKRIFWLHLILSTTRWQKIREAKNSLVKLRKKCSLAHSYVNSYKSTFHALKKYRILRRLTNNKKIVILRPDKGSGTVILNRDDYMKKSFDIISDLSKLKKNNCWSNVTGRRKITTLPKKN